MDKLLLAIKPALVSIALLTLGLMSVRAEPLSVDESSAATQAVGRNLLKSALSGFFRDYTRPFELQSKDNNKTIFLDSLLNAPNGDHVNQEVTEYKTGVLKGYKLVTGCQKHTCQTRRAGVMLDPENHVVSAVLLQRLCSINPDVGCKRQSNVVFAFRPNVQVMEDVDAQNASRNTADSQSNDGKDVGSADGDIGQDDEGNNDAENLTPDPLDAERELLMWTWSLELTQNPITIDEVRIINFTPDSSKQIR